MGWHGFADGMAWVMKLFDLRQVVVMAMVMVMGMGMGMGMDPD